MSQNDELKWICEQLKNSGVDFWIDSGTLLGLAREGGIMKGDHDIDLSMWSASEAMLEKVLPAVKNRGYRVSVKNYRGLNFKYKLTPQFAGSALEIDISLFRRENDHAWCPQIYCMPYPYSKRRPIYYLYGFPRRIIQEIFIRKNKVIVNNWPWSLSYKVYLVWVPSRFYEETTLFYDHFPVPKDYEAYLSFRYGTWKIPQKDWFFINDDGAIRHVSPEMVVGTINR